MTLPQIIAERNFEPTQYIIDSRDLSIKLNSFWQRIVVWITSWFSNRYSPIEVAKKVGEFFVENQNLLTEFEEKGRSFYVKNNLKKCQRHWSKSATSEDLKTIEEAFKKIVWLEKPLPGEFVILPPEPATETTQPEPTTETTQPEVEEAETQQSALQAQNMKSQILKIVGLGIISYFAFDARAYSLGFFDSVKRVWQEQLMRVAMGGIGLLSIPIIFKKLGKDTGRLITGSVAKRAVTLIEPVAGGPCIPMQIPEMDLSNRFAYMTELISKAFGASPQLSDSLGVAAELGILGTAFLFGNFEVGAIYKWSCLFFLLRTGYKLRQFLPMKSFQQKILVPAMIKYYQYRGVDLAQLPGPPELGAQGGEIVVPS